MSSGYVYDQNFAEERARLAGIESLWDPGSQLLLDELGITEGWRCLEVGAGGGSLVPWMLSRGATVTAIDIDTRFIESLTRDAVEVRRVDIRTDELPKSEFDLIHARQVLEHLAERREIIDRFLSAFFRKPAQRRRRHRCAFGRRRRRRGSSLQRRPAPADADDDGRNRPSLSRIRPTEPAAATYGPSPAACATWIRATPRCGPPSGCRAR